MTQFFSSILSALTVCNIHFCIWKYSKFIFMWSPIWSILICKICQFWEKATYMDGHQTFLERAQFEVTKNLYYVLSPRGAKKRYQLMDYDEKDSSLTVDSLTFEPIWKQLHEKVKINTIFQAFWRPRKPQNPQKTFALDFAYE